MDYTNVKLLGIYYSVQNVLIDNIAAPMAMDIVPDIRSVRDDFTLLCSKISQYTRSVLSEEKLKEYNSNYKKLFHYIDSGEIKPKKYLGHQLSAEQIVKQMQMHDSFMVIYDSLFAQIDDPETILSVKDATLSGIKKLKPNEKEMWMFTEMIENKSQRSPITIEFDLLQETIEILYEEFCDFYGPTATDSMLSIAVRESSAKVPEFSANSFL